MAVLFVAIVALFVAPRAAGYPWPVCGSTGSFAANDSTYLESINTIAATLPRNATTSPGLYATAHAGQVWAFALCRGDVNATSCSGCLAQGFQDLPSACAYSKEATMYYDTCFLHYYNLQLSASDDTDLSSAFSIAYSANATAEPARFDRVVSALLHATADYAADHSSVTRLYASGVVSFDQEIPEVYSWAQCTPVLTRARCRDCLANTIQALGTPLYSVGARVLGIRCGIRYESQPFLDGPMIVRLSAGSGPTAAPVPSPTSAPAPAPSPTTALVPNVVATVGGARKYSVPGMVLIIGLPTLAAANLTVGIFIWRRRPSAAQAKQPSPTYSSQAEDSESVDSMLMDISILRAATQDFAESNKLGEGGFGAVYKGTLPNSEEIAVKRLSKSSTQGVEELKNELTLVAKLKHKNLVRLVGVCLEQQERLLVYEFVSNRSLDQLLFIDIGKREQPLLNWSQRQRIIRGIARGLQYLHEDSHFKVVHRDLKASNVLLDADMNPKISDFGLARIFGRGQTQGVTNRVIGTYGYMAPEYVMRGSYSVKSDVFSFGVMVLEIVTGRKNSDITQSEDLLTMIWDHWMDGTVLQRVDPCMNGSFSESDVTRCIQVGLLCVQENPVDRPVMSAVAMMLGSEMVSLGAPSKPAPGFDMSTSPVNDGPEDHSID